MTVSQHETSRSYYDTAKEFWSWWQTDPNSDLMIDHPGEAIAKMLVRDGAHPIEAQHLSKLALTSVGEAEHTQ